MKKSFKKVLIVLIILLAVVLSALAFIRGMRRAASAAAEGAERYTVVKGDLSLTAVGSGKVVSADIKRVSAKGTISELNVSVGDAVKKGDLLARYVNAAGQTVDFTCEYDGVLTAVPGSLQSAVNYFEISTTDSLQVVVQITENDVNKISVGQSAVIYIDAISAQISGSVSRISQYGTATGDYSSYAVTVSFDKGDAGVLLGMTASAKITTQTKSGVYKVPVDAVIESGGKRFLLSSDWLEHSGSPYSDYYIQVTTGISDSEYVEVSGDSLENRVIVILPSSASSGFGIMRSFR